MMRFITPVILIGIAVAVFFMFSNPLYSNIGLLRLQAASYDKALSNAKEYKNEVDKLTDKNNKISATDKMRLEKFLPENIDNIRLILEIEQIALPYGMALKDVKYNATAGSSNVAAPGAPGAPGAPVVQGGAVVAPLKDYGVWELSFSTTGTYSNFLNFMRDLESNLRMVDISSIQFSSSTSVGSGTASSPTAESYKYDFNIKTYWLKN